MRANRCGVIHLSGTILVLLVSTQLLSAAQPILSFDVISDIHSANYTANLRNAFTDITTNDTASRALFMIGDLTQNANPVQYDTLMKVVTGNPKPVTYLTIGNHDVRSFGGYYTTYDAAMATFKAKTGMTNAYFELTISGYHFIMLGSDQNLKDQASIGSAELLWLKNTLAQNAAPDKPIFVFVHQPLINTVAETDVANGYNVSYPDGIVQDSAFRAILGAYPQAILFTGHTHALLTAANNYFKGFCHMVNDGAIVNNQGLFVKIYADSIAITGRNFSTKTTVWTKTIAINHTTLVRAYGGAKPGVAVQPFMPGIYSTVSTGRNGLGSSAIYITVPAGNGIRTELSYSLTGRLVAKHTEVLGGGDKGGRK